MTANIKIETDSAAFEAADEIATLNTSLSALKANMESGLQEVRSQHAPAIETLEGRIKERTAALKAYCSRKGVEERLFGEGRRSTESTAARFGWRDSAPTLKPLDTKEKLDDVAARLAAEGRTLYITIPEAKPAVNKQAIIAAGLTAGELADLGLRITTPTTFFVEAKDRVVSSPVTSRTA